MVPLHHRRSCLWVDSQQRAYNVFSSLFLRGIRRPTPLHFSSYKRTCSSDPEVRKFNDTLRTRTRRIFSNIGEQQQFQRSVSLTSVNEVATSLLETDRDVIKIILEHKYDVRKDPAFFDLVKEFLDASVVTSKFCDAALSSIQRARDNHLFVERIIDCMPSGKKLTKNETEEILTLMGDFRHAGNPFAGDLINALIAIRERYKTLLPKLRPLRKKLLNRKQAWRKVTSVMLATAVTGIAICSVLAAAMTSSEQSIASEFVRAAGVLDSGTDTYRSWVESLWITHEKEITEQRLSIVGLMEEDSFAHIHEVETIRTLIEGLIIDLKSIAYDIVFVEARTKLEGALELAVQDLKKKNEPFLADLTDLEKHIAALQKSIHSSRDELLVIQKPSTKLPFYRICCGCSKSSRSLRCSHTS